MGSFTYSARDKSGAIQKGSVFAADRAAATASLSSKGLTPILVKEIAAKGTKNGSESILSKIHFGSGVSLQDKVVFSRQFATMINAGVPIVQALGILGDQTESKKLKAVVSEVAKQVEGGGNLANALAGHPEVFNEIYVNMVRAGETGGLLDEVLDLSPLSKKKTPKLLAKSKVP